MAKEYRFTDDAAELDFNVDAQTVGNELERIKVSYGHVSPKAVVEEARPEDAPLHPAFEWRDEVAAGLYREHQATNLIRRVRVVAQPSQPRQAPVKLIQEEIPEEIPVDDYDPLSWDHSEAVSAVIAAKKLVEVLRQKATARFDSQKKIAANVALADLKQAEEDIADAWEALAAARAQATWKHANV